LLGRGLPTWRGVAARLDLLRSTGPRHAWHRLQQERALRVVVPSRRNLIAREVWSEAARELDASVTEIERGRFEIRRGATVAIVTGQTVALNSRSAMALAADKPTVYRLLADAGLPIPERLSFAANDLRAARVFLARDGPCVVKPARGTGGDGVTGEIRSASELRRAALAASRFARQLLIESQVEGEVFRVLVLDGQLLDVVRRRRPAIRGDGRSTVEELIFVSPALASEVAAAAEVLGLRLAGVDVVTPTPAAALAASGGAIIDVNEAPGLHHHAHVAGVDGGTRVAVPILRALLDKPTEREMVAR